MPLVRPTEPPLSVQIENAQKAEAAPTVVQVSLSKDERISRQGAIQAAFNNPYLCGIAASLEDHKRVAMEQAEWLLRWTNKQEEPK